MALRRLAEHQPDSFVFTPENAAWCQEQLQKYPSGRQASAVIPILWRALEVVTFYTMFNLHPVGRHLVQVCTTTPCWLRGSDEIVATCKKYIHPGQGEISADGAFTWMEAECLGACVNAPMVLIDKDPFE